MQPANAQVGVYVGTPPQQAQLPPRNGAWGDRDRDGDGVPNQWDRNPGNPYRRQGG